MPRKSSYITILDMFCGCGGSSQGAAAAGGEIVMAINHWDLAVETHNNNFPQTAHDVADVTQTNPARYPSTRVLLASPECPQHSLSNGKKKTAARNQQGLWEWVVPTDDPAAVRSRATMHEIPRYAEYHDYEIIIVENVAEARKWRSWDDWIRWMNNLGYDHKVVYLNSMFFPPTPQSRDRMYVVFWKKGITPPDLDFRPPAFCHECGENIEAVQSWKNPHKKWGRWGKYDITGKNNGQYVYRCPKCAEIVIPYYYAAANCIDWTNLGDRIADRAKPLKPKTMRRLQNGLDDYLNHVMVLGDGPADGLYTAWTVNLAHGGKSQRRFAPVTAALMTQTTAQTMSLMTAPIFAHTTHEGSRDSTQPGHPLPAQTGWASMAMAFLGSLRGTQSGQLVNEAIGAQLASGANHALVSLPQHFGYANGASPGRTMDQPLKAQHTENNNAVLIPPIIAKMLGNGRSKSADQPVGTVMGDGLQHGVLTPPYLAELYGSSSHRSAVDRPVGAMTAGGINYGVVTPPPFVTSYYNTATTGSDVTQAVGALTTRDRHTLVTPVSESVDINDCHFRMFTPGEVIRAMAFQDDYVVLGTKRQKIRQAGNAVTPPVMQWLVERCVAVLE